MVTADPDITKTRNISRVGSTPFELFLIELKIPSDHKFNYLRLLMKFIGVQTLSEMDAALGNK